MKTKMCNENVNRSESTTKKDVDEWLDGEGRFHRKIVVETITSPINTNQAASRRISFVNPNVKGFPGLWSPIYTPEPKSLWGNNMSDKPLIDFKAIMENGKKFLESHGMTIDDLFNKEQVPTAEELVQEAKKDDKPKTQEPIKPLKIVYNKDNQKKEVLKCPKKQTKTQMMKVVKNQKTKK